MKPLAAPELLTSAHEVQQFSSGVPMLDEWLRRRAFANQASGASRTYVVAERRTVVAYYALASGGIVLDCAAGRFRRNMPDPIPVAILGRLAVDTRYQGRGIGRALIRDAAQRIRHAASVIGIRGIVVHAISEQARDFYVSVGFDPSPLEPMTLMITLRDIDAVLGLSVRE